MKNLDYINYLLLCVFLCVHYVIGCPRKPKKNDKRHICIIVTGELGINRANHRNIHQGKCIERSQVLKNGIKLKNR